MSQALRPVPAEPHIPAKPGGVAPSGRIRRARHFLVLPADVEVDEVELLALSRFPSAQWEVEPAPVAGGRGVLEPGALRISRHTVLVGPYASGPRTRGESARGENAAGCTFDVICPRERGDAPFPGVDDPDGVFAAFAQGMPVRDEGRVINWLVAVSRRLAATLLLDGTQVINPEADAHPDLTVYSDVWLAPEAALATVRSVEPRAVFAPGGQDWAGPPSDVAARELPSGVELPQEVRAQLHEAADHVDMAALSAEPQLSGYAIHVDLGVDGLIAIEIGGEEALPMSLLGLPWAEAGAVAYRARWFAHDDEHELLGGGAGVALGHRISRGRAVRHLNAVVRALHGVTGGEALDHDDFLIHPEDL